MCSKHVEAWNKLVVKQKFCASSWLITEINILRCTVSKTSKKKVLPVFHLRFTQKNTRCWTVHKTVLSQNNETVTITKCRTVAPPGAESCRHWPEAGSNNHGRLSCWANVGTVNIVSAEVIEIISNINYSKTKTKLRGFSPRAIKRSLKRRITHEKIRTTRLTSTA